MAPRKTAIRRFARKVVVPVPKWGGALSGLGVGIPAVLAFAGANPFWAAAAAILVVAVLLAWAGIRTQVELEELEDRREVRRDLGHFLIVGKGLLAHIEGTSALTLHLQEISPAWGAQTGEITAWQKEV